MLTKEEILNIFKDSEALLEGHFKLTSGRHSNRYMQCAKVLMEPKYTEALCNHLSESFKDDGVEVVIGPATGGIILSYEMARQMNVPSIFTERVDGKMVLRRNFKIEKGQKVLVIEDVVTTGGSVREVVQLVEEMGGIVVGVALLVDRSNGQADLLTKKVVPALSMDVVSYEESECPLCKEGTPAIKPGSRNL